MAKKIEDEVAYYYDFHPTEEDLMGETPLHSALIQYLTSVLQQLFQGQQCAVYENFNCYQTPNTHEYPLAPDIAVIKGVDYRDDIRSWRVGKTGPAPHVVFEIASEETWKKDLQDKPMLYAQMGVQEYFAYDPNEPLLRRNDPRRLFGWRLAPGSAYPLPSDSAGRLWSTQLDSFLIPDGKWLRLTDRQGLPRLTLTQAEAEARIAAERRTEAETEARIAAERRTEAETEARKVAELRAMVETEARKAETEARKAAERKAAAEAEARKVADSRAEAESRKVEILAEILRSMGVDPEHI